MEALLLRDIQDTVLRVNNPLMDNNTLPLVNKDILLHLNNHIIKADILPLDNIPSRNSIRCTTSRTLSPSGLSTPTSRRLPPTTIRRVSTPPEQQYFDARS